MRAIITNLNPSSGSPPKWDRPPSVKSNYSVYLSFQNMADCQIN